MLRSMSGTQFREWRAYAELEPFDEVREDIRNARVVHTVLSLFGSKATFDDCLLKFDQNDEEHKEEAPAPKVKDWRAIKAAGQMWADALNAQPNRDPAHEATH